MKITICDENHYRNKLRQYFDSVLNSRLMDVDADNTSDKEIMDVIVDYLPSESENNNHCTWVYIGDIVTSEYNGKIYQSINMISGSDTVFSINLSQFLYFMSPNIKIHNILPSFDSRQADYVCTIDGKRIDPITFFPIHKGEKLLLIFSFPATTSFDKTKTCYLFAHNNISSSYIREYIKFVQFHTIKNILEYPVMSIPATTIKCEIENNPNSRPAYFHNVLNACVIDFALKLFEEEYKIKFEYLLKRFSNIYK